MAIDVPGTLILDSHGLMVEAAVADMGIANVSASAAQHHLDIGSVVTVLEDWCPYVLEIGLYYPGSRHVPPTLRALVDMIKSIRQ